jgi:MFS family permease
LSSFIGARFLLSFFSTINTVAAPMLLVEIAPPLHRATVAGIYNTLYYIGSIVATFSVFPQSLTQVDQSRLLGASYVRCQQPFERQHQVASSPLAADALSRTRLHR